MDSNNVELSVELPSMDFGRNFSLEPEARLYRAVLFRMLADLGIQVPGTPAFTGRNKFSSDFRDFVKDRKAAIRWFKFNQTDVETVCDFAGADFTRIMKLAERQIAENRQAWLEDDRIIHQHNSLSDPEYTSKRARQKKWKETRRIRLQANGGCTVQEVQAI